MARAGEQVLWLSDQTLIQMGKAHLLPPTRRTTIQAVDEFFRTKRRSDRPHESVMVELADGTHVFIAGAGECEVAELQEIAHGLIEEGERRHRAGKPTIDFDSLREKYGKPPREKFDQLVREAFAEKATHLKRSARTGGI